MKEIVLLTGGRRTTGTDVKLAQSEALDPLQGFFTPFGSCLIDGCEITVNTPGTPNTYDIAEGIVGILHADGYKLARFAGATNVNLPGYLTITKTIVQGDYGEVGFEVTKDRRYDYTATFTAGAPSAGDDTELVIPDPSTGAINTAFDKLGQAANSTPITRTLTIFDTTKSVKFWINRVARTLHVQATLTINNFNNPSIVLAEGEVPLFQTALPAYMRPAVKQSYFAEVVNPSTPYPFKGSNQSDYITVLTGHIDTNGTMVLRWVRPAGTISTYDIRINAVLQLD